MSASIAVARRAPARWLAVPAVARACSALTLVASRGLAMLAQVAVQLAVAALSGPVGLGTLQVFTAWSNVLGEVLARGWPTVVLKRVSVAWSRGERPTGRAALDGARCAVLRGWRAGLAVAAALVLAGTLFSHGIDGPEDLWLAPALLAAALLFALVRIGAEALKGADAPLMAVTLENLALPLVLLLLCLVCVVLGLPLGQHLLVFGSVLGFLAGAALIARAVRTRLGRPAEAPAVRERPDDRRERRALWFSSVQGIAFLQLPFLVLPIFTDTATVGIYAVAHKLVNVVTTLLILLSSVFGPAFARAVAEGDRGRLRRLLTRTQLLSLAVFGPAAVALLIWSDGLAGLFHVPPSDLHGFMLILVAGQLVNAATGLPGVLLNMAGAARTEWRISLAALSAALLLAVPLGLTHGAPGLAALFSAVIALKNIASWLAARRHLKKGVLVP